MTPADVERVFGTSRLQIPTGGHVEVFREVARSGEQRRYTKRFLETPGVDFRPWTEREWRVLTRLGRLPGAPVARALDLLPADEHGPARLQTRDAGATLDQWATLVPLRRGETTLRNVFEDCANWWQLARQCMVALDALHALGFVHLELKGDNICVPWAPAGAGRPVVGQPLAPRIKALTLIDVAFSLVPEVELIGPLPLLKQPAYEYQSPRLLHALEEGRRGSLAATRALDWRCDFFSLAAMLWRFLPEAEDGPGFGWTEERHDQAKEFVQQLLDVHGAPLPTQWPHRQLIALASLRLREPDLQAALRAGCTFDPERELPLDAEPTPPTRVAETMARKPAPEPTDADAPIASAPMPFGEAHDRPIASAPVPLDPGSAPRTSAPMPLGEAHDRPIASAPMPLDPGSAPRTSAPMRLDPRSAPRTSAPMPLDPGSASRASAPMPLDRRATPRASAPSPLDDGRREPTLSAPTPLDSDPRPPRSSAPTPLDEVGGTPRVSAPAPLAEASGDASQRPPSDTTPMAWPEPAPGDASAAAAQFAARAATAAIRRRRRQRAVVSAVAAVMVLGAVVAAWWFMNGQPSPGVAASIPLPPHQATPDRDAPASTVIAAPGSTASATPDSAAPIAVAPVSPPATESNAATASAASQATAPPASAVPSTPADPALAAAAEPRERGAASELDSIADALLRDRLPTVAQAAAHQLARVLAVAARATEFRRRGDVRVAIQSLRSSAPRPAFAAPVRSDEARRLNDAAFTAYWRHDDVELAVRLQTRAFAANPFDSEVVGNFAFFRLRQKPPHAEAARQLALHSLTLNDPRFPSGRIEDWTAFAVASALTGHDVDARNAWFASMALASDLQHQCNNAVRAEAFYGERLRPSVQAMLQRARSSAAYGRCEAALAPRSAARAATGGERKSGARARRVIP